jgi:hypothetical protein
VIAQVVVLKVSPVTVAIFGLIVHELIAPPELLMLGSVAPVRATLLLYVYVVGENVMFGATGFTVILNVAVAGLVEQLLSELHAVTV